MSDTKKEGVMKAMNHSRKLVLLVLLTIFVALLSGCSNNSTGDSTKPTTTNEEPSSGLDLNANAANQLKMVIWGDTDQYDLVKKVADVYEQSHKDVNITITQFSANYEENIATLLAAPDNSPDLFFSNAMMIDDLVNADMIAEISDFMNTKDSYIEPEEVNSGLWGTARNDTKYYGLPFECIPAVIYYNEQMFADLKLKTPQQYVNDKEWNWTNFEKTVRAFAATGKFGFIQENDWVSTLSWIWSNGGNLFNQNGAYTFAESKEAQEAVEYIARLNQEGSIMYEKSMPQGLTKEILFLTQQIPMIQGGIGATNLFATNKVLKYDVVQFPSNTKYPTEPVGVFTNYVVMNKKTKNEKETLKFLTYFASEKGQLIRNQGNVTTLPTIPAADVSLKPLSEKMNTSTFKLARDMGIAFGTVRTNFQQNSGMLASYESVWDSLLSGIITSELAIEQLKKLGE